MKKIFAVLISLALLTGAMLTLVACDNQNNGTATTVMNISLNPEVEFVLDGNGKVLTVNALNEEGNLIISAESFEGKTAEEAAKLFVQVSHETGFIVKGNAQIADNEIEIEITGDTSTINDIYNKVKTSIDTYFTKENITAQVEKVEAMTKAELQKLVAECAPYIEKAKLEALSHMELIEELYNSRKETHEMYSQELKKAYYEAKAMAMDTAKLQALKSEMGSTFGVILEGLLKTYTDAVADIEKTRMDLLVSAESDYQVKLATFREKKIAFLKLREDLAEKAEISALDKAGLNAAESALDLAESALKLAGETANSTLDLAKAGLTTAYNMVVSTIESAQVAISDHIDAIIKVQEEQVPVFAAEFESAYAQAVADAKASWANMKTELEKETAAQ